MPVTVTSPVGFSGRFIWVQYVAQDNEVSTLTDNEKETCNSSGEDTKYPASSNSVFSDSPQVPMSQYDVENVITQSYNLYLMWCPASSCTASQAAIPIAVAELNWSWAADAKYSSATKSWAFNGTPGAPTWSVTISPQPANPEWTINVTNSEVCN